MTERVLVFGDDPCGTTGFGRVVARMVDAVAEAGCTPEVVALKPRHGLDCPAATVHRPPPDDPRGWQLLADVLEQTRARVVISLGDPWDVQGLVHVRRQRPFTWLGYTPVDSTPFPRYVLVSTAPQQYLDVAVILREMDHIATFTAFGVEAIRAMLTEAGVAPPPIAEVGLGVDGDRYAPRDRAEARAVFQGAISAEHLLFTAVKVNSMRAGFDTLLTAWARYLERARAEAPEVAARSRLYLHTNVQGSGYPLPVLVQRHGLDASVLLNPTLEVGAGVPEEDMVRLHASSDVAVSAARGEGFGLNVLEPMSCAVPAVVPDYGGPAEYGGEGVVRVPIAATYNPEFATTDFAIVDVEAMAATLLDLALDPLRRAEVGAAGRAIALGRPWSRFTETWAALIRAALR